MLNNTLAIRLLHRCRAVLLALGRGEEVGDNMVFTMCMWVMQAPSAEELKELEREHNRQAQVEAERRKQRKQQEREKKRQRALQVRSA